MRSVFQSEGRLEEAHDNAHINQTVCVQDVRQDVCVSARGDPAHENPLNGRTLHVCEVRQDVQKQRRRAQARSDASHGGTVSMQPIQDRIGR
jgi:hypothetical protein